jgi:hypothetical protein
MLQMLRRIGIAFGSLMIAWLAVSVVAGPLFGTAAFGNALIWLITIVLGGLIYRDIMRRERRSA